MSASGGAEGRIGALEVCLVGLRKNFSEELLGSPSSRGACRIQSFSLIDFDGLRWIGLVWAGLGWIGLVWAGLGWIGLD